ncbi:MAG: capsule biosynthesis protein [Rhodobacteraceae bacterium]|nr:MAG: capsule biosynthesis protein [Paracoccaceae bacterium]
MVDDLRRDRTGFSQLPPDEIADAEFTDEDSLPVGQANAPHRDAEDRPIVQVHKRRRVTPQDTSAELQSSAPEPAEAETTEPQQARPQPGQEADDPVDITDLEGRPNILESLEAIRNEGLNARQLRMAMRVAQKHGIRPTSAHEAVLLLRQRGIDPFARTTMLDLAETDETEPTRALTTRAETIPATRDIGGPISPAKDRMARVAKEREKELRRVQQEIAKRRRKRMLLLGVRLLVFVTLPTLIVSWYFYMIATPMYATQSQFVIQQADGGAIGGELGGMLPGAAGMGGQSEAPSVQSYLQSLPAMIRLDREEGFKAHFSSPEIDILRRLPPDATDSAAFKRYRRNVLIGFDPTEGVVRLEVIAASPEVSERFSRALIRFAEEHVDMMTQRMRDSQMNDARQNLEDAQRQLIEARLAVVELQESSSILSGEVELSLLSQQLSALDAELLQTRLALQELRSNPRPNQARLQQVERRESALIEQVSALRGSMTRDSDGGVSLARTQSLLITAEAEVQTREMLRAQAMQQMEQARIDVGRQVRYLALSVEPVAPDEPTYPRKLESSAVAFLIFLGLYLFVSMTASVLREQISG